MSYKRVVITEFGDPNVLQVVEEQRLPEPATGEVRVKLLATSANFTDVMIRRGMYPGIGEPPFSPGCDMVGLVDAVGQGITGFETGQRVADLTFTGAYSEYLCLPAARLVPVPENLDSGEAVSLVLTYVTAWQMLHREARLRQGQRILVHGAGGAVGTALLQLGSLLGLEMYGTDARDKRELVESLGATFIDYLSEDFVQRVLDGTGGGVDAVFDPIGGGHFKRSFRSLRRGGVLVAFGFYNAVMGKGHGQPIPLDAARLMLWNLLPNGRSTKLYSIQRWRRRHPEWFREDLTRLFELLSGGQIKPEIEKRMPMLEALHAHELLEQGQVRGRIVLEATPAREGDLSTTFGEPVPETADAPTHPG